MNQTQASDAPSGHGGVGRSIALSQARRGSTNAGQIGDTQMRCGFTSVPASCYGVYAVPFFSPANGGTITRLGLDVVYNPGTAGWASHETGDTHYFPS
jgi:hypothetical protein